MSDSARGIGYPARFTGLVISLVFLSVAVLYVAFAGRPGGSPGDLFGEPFGSSRPAGTAAVDSSSAVVDERAHLAAPGAADAEPLRTAEASPSERARQAPRLTGTDALEAARGAAARRTWTAALHTYDRLVRERPGDRDLALERARVLGWSGDHAAAAEAFLAADPAPDREPDVVLELVMNLYWAGRPVAADAALEPLIARRPADADLDSLRTRIRTALVPEVDVARRWLATRDSGIERLALARALVRAGRPPESLLHYRRALLTAAPEDSLALEIAAVAVQADSLGLAVEALQGYVAARPGDHGTRMRLARLLRDAGAGRAARLWYQGVIDATDDARLRFEMAQLDAWSGHHDPARAALERLHREEPDRADVLRLLGDLAHWDGDHAAAVAHYRAALSRDPSDPSLAAAIAAAEAAIRESDRTAPAPHLLRWSVRSESFRDSDGFRWLGTRAARSWHTGSARLDLTVQQELWGHDRRGAEPDAGPGLGIELATETPLSPSLRLRLGIGARTYGSGFDFGSWAAELAHADLRGASVEIGYRREPTFRRAATAAALQADATSDIGRFTMNRGAGDWHVWSQLELERLGSTVGETVRGSGALALRRELGAGWAAYATTGALITDGPSPILAGWGPLYWSPASYATASAGGAFRTLLSPAWSLEVKLAPGVAWIDERDDLDSRYASGRSATLTSGFDAAYRHGSWSASLGGEWSGAYEGYRASALRVGFHYSPARP